MTLFSLSGRKRKTHRDCLSAQLFFLIVTGGGVPHLNFIIYGGPKRPLVNLHLEKHHPGK